MVEVRWSGDDENILERYDKEYRVESMGWNDLVMETLGLEAMFAGEVGLTYTVRLEKYNRIRNDCQAEKAV